MAPPPNLASLRSRAQAITHALASRHETLAIGETSCGGLLATLFCIPSEGQSFAGSIIAYSVAARSKLLNDVAAPGAAGIVSDEFARHLAETVRATLGASWGLAETGIAGPQTGRRSSKPAGLAYIAVVGPIMCATELRTGRDSRAGNLRAFAAAALASLEAAIRETEQERS
jgi:PncC family amidohydrolase